MAYFQGAGGPMQQKVFKVCQAFGSSAPWNWTEEKNKNARRLVHRCVIVFVFVFVVVLVISVFFVVFFVLFVCLFVSLRVCVGGLGIALYWFPGTGVYGICQEHRF